MPRLLALILALLPMAAQEPDLPLALNLPTADQLGPWQPAIRFTHRFVEPAKGNPRDLYGWDGGNYAGVGLDLGIGGVPGLMAQVYRTSDGKALVLGLQQRLLSTPRFGAALRVERFDEGVRRIATSLGTLGISGAAVQAPAGTAGRRPDGLPGADLAQPGEHPRGRVPHRRRRVALGVRRTPRRARGLLPAAVAARRQPLRAELVDRLPLRHPQPPLHRARHHRQRQHRPPGAGGDYAGGPRPGGQWSFGFNLVRMF